MSNLVPLNAQTPSQLFTWHSMASSVIMIKCRIGAYMLDQTQHINTKWQFCNYCHNRQGCCFGDNNQEGNQFYSRFRG